MVYRVYIPVAPELGLGLSDHCSSCQSVEVIKDMGSDKSLQRVGRVRMEMSLKLILLEHHQLRDRKRGRAWKCHWGVAGGVGGEDWPCEPKGREVYGWGSGHLCHMLLRDQAWSKNWKKSIGFKVWRSTRSRFSEAIWAQSRMQGMIGRWAIFADNFQKV